MTTANYPDVMMPTYSESPWSCLIFISFIIITTYLLRNLVLAYIFQSYSKLMKEQYNNIALFERQRLYLAFSTLDPFHTGFFIFYFIFLFLTYCFYASFYFFFNSNFYFIIIIFIIIIIIIIIIIYLFAFYHINYYYNYYFHFLCDNYNNI